MQVFKAFFKVIKNNIGLLTIYIAIFVFFAVFLGRLGTKQAVGFSETKLRIVFFNDDEGSPIAKGLEDFLREKAILVEMEDHERKLQDALFFRDIEYILRIPDGFTEGFLNGEEESIRKTVVPDSTSAFYIDLLVNKYLNTYRIYAINAENLTAEEIVGRVSADLNQQATVEMGSYGKKASVSESTVAYFNYFSYSLFAILVLGLGAVLLVFNKPDLKRRNLCSPVKLRSMNVQMVLGCMSFAMVTWAILMVACFILYGDYMLSLNGMLMLANSLAFTMAALSISFLLANVIKTSNGISAASNIVTLGSSFISGVFVPQELLGEKVLTIASFTPTYWFVTNNKAIGGLVEPNWTTLTPIVSNLLIILGFAVAALAITLVVIKQRRTAA